MSYLAHHGVLGMKWGVRRYQNKDGSLTAAGRKRYYVVSDKYNTGVLTMAPNKRAEVHDARNTRKADKFAKSVQKKVSKDKEYKKALEEYQKAHGAVRDRYYKEFNKWEQGKGKYKNLDYYDFKDTYGTDFMFSKEFKNEHKTRMNLESVMKTIISKNPKSKKTLNTFRTAYVHSLNENPQLVKSVSYGEYAVKQMLIYIA